MALKNKYQREKQQYTNDSGRTWIDVSPANYRRGRLIEAGSEDCNTVEWKEVTGSWFCIGFNETQYRWVTVSDEYVCVGYDKYSVEKKQSSSDGGTTWTDVVPLETRTGSLIESDSRDCGFIPYIDTYLTVESLEDNNDITFTRTNGLYSLQRTIYVSTDNGTNWTSKSSGYSTPTVLATLNTGDKLLIKGTNNSYGAPAGDNVISSTKKINVYGNIMSLVYGDDFIGETEIMAYYAFAKMFSGNPYLISAENLVLPSTTLAKDCYSYMFSDCTNLVKAPELPATTLAENCYLGMFEDCTSLVNAPELSATTLASYCCNYMFNRCTSLVTAPSVLPATTLATYCYQYMFDGCTSLTTAPELPATKLASYCYRYMFRGCTSLVTAPTLSATTLADECYREMFKGCIRLETAPSVLPATKLADYCYYGMFAGCTGLTSVPTLPATTLTDSCYRRMFQDCTGLTRAPELPATRLAYECYQYMFYNCTSLNYIKCLATDISSSDCTGNWVYNVASTGTFVKDASMTSWTTGESGIPSGWTVVTQ